MENFEKIGEFELNLESLAKILLQSTLAITFVATVLHYLINPFPSFSITNLLLAIGLVVVYYIALIALHELCHLIGFIIFCGARFSSLKVGVDLKKGIAYATTSDFMRNKDARKALLLPFWLTGLLPLIIGIYFNHFPLTLVSAWMIVGALGDFKMYSHLKKLDSNIYVLDDSENPKLHFYKKTEHVN